MGEQGVPAGLDSEAKQPPKRRLEGEELCNPQDMGAVGQGRLPRVFCYRVGDDTALFDLWEHRELKFTCVSHPQFDCTDGKLHGSKSRRKIYMILSENVFTRELLV